MVKFSQDKKKKKGPKGKKAREKAKLDRQWGERSVVVVAPHQQSSTKSKMKTSSTTKPITTPRENKKQVQPWTEDEDADNNSNNNNDNNSNNDDDDDAPKCYTKLMDHIQHQQHQHQQHHQHQQQKWSRSTHRLNGDDDHDDDDDQDDDQDEMEDDPLRHEDDDDYRYGAPDVLSPVSNPNDNNNNNNNSTTIENTTTTTTLYDDVDPFQQRFVQNITTPVDIPSHHWTTDASSTLPLPPPPPQQQLPPIQDNENLRVFLSPPSLLETFDTGRFLASQNTDDMDRTTDRSTNTTSISKRQLQQWAAASMPRNLSFYSIGTGFNTTIKTNNNNNNDNDHRRPKPQYVIPTLVGPAVSTYADTLITTNGMDYGHQQQQQQHQHEYGILDRLTQLHHVIARHLLTHVIASRCLIHAHNRKLSKLQQKGAAVPLLARDDENIADTMETTLAGHTSTTTATTTTLPLLPEPQVDWSRDQGFTRPTVLVLLPTRNCCFDFVQILLSILYGPPHHHHNHLKKKKTNHVEDDHDKSSPYGPNVVDHFDRFVTEFGPISPDVATSMDETLKLSQHRQNVLRQKGTVWNELFGDHRNDDDDYKIGLQINVKKIGRPNESSSSSTPPTTFPGTVKLYSDFYRSDVIIASPLGLKMAVANKKNHDGDDDNDDDPDNHKTKASKLPDSSTDFLSSIEICLIGRGDVLLQQNWDHVTDVLKELNHTPKSMNMTDFSRVRPYFLSGQAHLWKQLIICSTHSDPMITSCFKRFGTSHNGRIKITRQFDVEEASLNAVRLPITRQVFQRVPTTSSFVNAGSDRVQYFCKCIWPEIEKQKQKHTLIFIPSYFDFVMLRNILLQRKEDGIALIDFVSVTEYSRITEVSRGRARFLQGRKEVMLFTGRAHFFLRHAIKGVRHLVFLGVPEQAAFYSEHVNRLNEGLPSSLDETINDETANAIQHTTCLTLFTKYDSYALERIVGSTNCSRMVKGEKSTYYFSS